MLEVVAEHVNILTFVAISLDSLQAQIHCIIKSIKLRGDYAKSDVPLIESPEKLSSLEYY